MENRKIVTAGYVSLDITPSIRAASGVTLHDMIQKVIEGFREDGEQEDCDSRLCVA